MKKEIMYDPVAQGSFRMMFGFKQPSCYRHAKWVSIAKVKNTEASRRLKTKVI
jgi:hypothetical protein|tara:strand:+ start:39 stop:197 length:159 start_codon:yes stop_codon:yes gene_type:complete